MPHLTVIGAHVTPKPAGIPATLSGSWLGEPPREEAIVITAINGHELAGHETEDEISRMYRRETPVQR